MLWTGSRNRGDRGVEKRILRATYDGSVALLLAATTALGAGLGLTFWWLIQLTRG